MNSFVVVVDPAVLLSFSELYNAAMHPSPSSSQKYYWSFLETISPTPSFSAIDIVGRHKALSIRNCYHRMFKRYNRILVLRFLASIVNKNK